MHAHTVARTVRTDKPSVVAVVKVDKKVHDRCRTHARTHAHTVARTIRTDKPGAVAVVKVRRLTLIDLS